MRAHHSGLSAAALCASLATTLVAPRDLAATEWLAQDPPASSVSTPTNATPAPPAEVAPQTATQRRERARVAAEDALRKLMIPPPMSLGRLNAFLGGIAPSMAGSEPLAQAHSLYRETIEKQNETATRQILRLLPAAFNFDSTNEVFEPRATPELIALLALRDKSTRQSMAAERTLLEAIEGATPDDLKSRYARSLLAWRFDQLPSNALLPSTRVTLFELLGQVALDSATLATLDPIFAEYSRTLAQSFAQRARLIQNTDSARAIVETTAGMLWRFAPAETAASVESELAALEDRDFANELEIRAVQFDLVDRVRSRLQPRDGRKLVELWQRTLHPELFEDERLLGKMVEESLALPSFSPDHDTALLDALETSYQRLEPLSRRACEAADLVLPRLVTRTRASMVSEIDARIAVLEAQHKRRAIVKDMLQRIRTMVGDADLAATARIDDAIATTDSLERADAFEHRSLAARLDALADEPAQATTDRSTNNPATPPALESAPAPGKPLRTESADAPGGATNDAPARSSRGSRGSRGNAGN